jgi:hypothetical protein
MSRFNRFVHSIINSNLTVNLIGGPVGSLPPPRCAPAAAIPHQYTLIVYTNLGYNHKTKY